MFLCWCKDMYFKLFSFDTKVYFVNDRKYNYTFVYKKCLSTIEKK